MFSGCSQLMWAHSHVIWSRATRYSQLIWSQNSGCFWARRFMFSGRYNYQAMFEAEENTNDPNSPYFLIQRQFETSDGGRCYIETHDEKYIGHFRLRRVEFTPEGLSIEFDRPSDNLVKVTFSMAVSDFEEASQVIKIISGEVDPQ